jgi:hypothetical protein
MLLPIALAGELEIERRMSEGEEVKRRRRRSSEEIERLVGEFRTSTATYRFTAIAMRNRQRLERKIKASIRCPLVRVRDSFSSYVSCLHTVQMMMGWSNCR